MKTKTLNAMCICNENLYEINTEICSVLPCEHLYHMKCIKTINMKICSLCLTKIDKFVNINQINILIDRFLNTLLYLKIKKI